MAMAIKASSGVELSDSDRDENGRTERRRSGDRRPATARRPVDGGRLPQIDRLASRIAGDVFRTHEILKKLLESGSSDRVATLLAVAEPPTTAAADQKTIRPTDAGTRSPVDDADKASTRSPFAAVRLQTHKQIEQRRRHELSKNLSKLQTLLYPGEKNRGRLPQLSILGSAITKVRTLKRTNEKLLTKLDELSAYHKKLCSRLAELGHPVDNLPDVRSATDEEQVPHSVSDNMKDVNAENSASYPGSNCCSTSPSQSCCDSYLDTDSSFQSDIIKQDSEIGSGISEVASAPDKVADCDESEARSSLDEIGCDRLSSPDLNTQSPLQPQPATDLLTGSMKSSSKSDNETASADGPCIVDDRHSPTARRSPKQSRPATPASSCSGSQGKTQEFPSLLGRMFEDVKNSLSKCSQESSSSTSNKVTIAENSKKPVSLTCVPESGLVLTKCDRCGERVAFSSKVAGLVICPACSTVIIHFTPSMLSAEQAKKDDPPPPKPSLATKRKKASVPEEVIDLDSDSDPESSHHESKPSRVTPSDVLDILKDGVRGYVDNVDGDEVIVVLK